MSYQIHRLNTALEGRYRLERQIGEGGMATVYLADDLRHGRSVAVKVLKPELAAAVAAERFLAEIKTTANLQHPNILPLFDSGEAAGSLFYVMPYVEGETLRERLNRDKQLPVDDAINIASDVAEALQAAHDEGIVHRDVKPANILLSRGRSLVTDFGIALALNAAGEGRLTETGVSLGTPQYMSPEQAAGDRTLTPATDIYSLGCVVYEMLVGVPPFTGVSAQAILGKTLNDDPPPASSQRHSVPRNVDSALETALARLPADRFKTAAGFREAMTNPTYSSPANRKDVARWDEGGRIWRWIALSTFGIALAAVALAASMTIHTEDQPRMRTVRFLVSPAPEIPLRSLAVAPNGSAVVYRGIEQGTTRLYVREIDELETRPIPGTESASQPFFSPNGEWLGFYTDREIRRVPVGGGSPVTISAKATDPLYGATWGSDDVIVYGASDGNLMRVPAFGGEAEILAAPDPAQGETGLRWPTYLPNGRDLVFTASAGDPTISRIGTYQARSDEARRLLIVGTQALSAGTGHLIVWQADESVVAVPFDEDRLVTTGDGVVVLRGVGALALSSEGSLAMMPAVSEPQRLVLVDATGSERPLADQERTFPSEEWEWGFLYPRFGPSGDRVALATDGHIWVYDLGQGTLQKLTFEGENTFPSWTPDGMDIVFSSGREGRRSLYTVPANGSGTPELLLESANLAWESGISRDGEWIAFTEGFQDLSTKVDVVAASLHSTEGQRIPIAQTRYNERSTDLSPDGRWIAYVSNESGRDEVYVSAFPRPGARTQVSIDGGNSPTWASDGETLYYRATSGMQAAMLEAGPSVRVTDHRTLFDDSPYVRSLYYANYDVDPVSGDFLMTVRGDGASAQIVLVVNWSEELKRLMGG